MSRLRDLTRRQGNKCFWCRRPIGFGKHSIHPNLDHVIPRWMNGPDTIDNLVASCVECNHDRGELHEPNRPDPTGLNEWVKRQGHFARHKDPRLRTSLNDIITAKS